MKGRPRCEHSGQAERCPLLPGKRTSASRVAMAVKCHKQTSGKPLRMQKATLRSQFLNSL
jgi:hypothetical protein